METYTIFRMKRIVSKDEIKIQPKVLGEMTSLFSAEAALEAAILTYPQYYPNLAVAPKSHGQ